MANKVKIEEFMKHLSMSIHNFNKAAIKEDRSFMVNDIKFQVPCFLEYERDTGDMNISCLDLKAVTSKNYDPAVIARVELSGSCFLDLKDNEDKAE